MNFKHFCSALFISAAVVATISCKKDEETETKPSLSGSLRFSGLPEYIVSVRETGTAGDDTESIGYEVTPKGVHHPNNGSIGYYWKLTPRTDPDATAKNDTVNTENGSTTLIFKDSLYTCTVTCGAFADGYYDSSVSTYTTIVRPGINGSVTLADFPSDYASGNWKDASEVNEEYTVIGNYKWQRRNLPPKTIGGTTYGTPFKNCEAMADVYGGYFTYDDVFDGDNNLREGICPEGWTLPDDNAWRDLGKALSGQDCDIANGIPGITGKMMVNARFNADEKNPEDKEEEYVMWEYWPEVDITNSSALSVIPAGYANIYKKDGKVEAANFTGAYEAKKEQVNYAAFLTADRSGDNGEMVRYRYIIENDKTQTLHLGTYNRDSFAASVRCVQEK